MWTGRRRSASPLIRAALGAMPTVGADAPLEARWIVAELHSTAAKVNQALENYRFDDAANIDLPVLLGQLLRLVSGDREAAARFLRGAPTRTQTKAALTTLVSVFEAALAAAVAVHAVSDGRAVACGLRWRSAGEVDRVDAVSAGLLMRRQDKTAVEQMDAAAKRDCRDSRAAQGDWRRGESVDAD